MIDMANAYHDLELDIACLNFRGCSGEPNDKLGFYHLGFTDDLIHFLDLQDCSQHQPLYLSSFSLGCNMMIKALGDLKADAIKRYNIQGAAFFCSPFDATRHYKRLWEPGINSSIYANSLLNSLKNKAQLQLERVCANDPDTIKFDYRGAMEAKTIYDFENAYIAPVYGFDDTLDYLSKTAPIHVAEDVAVPTLILNGADDPFFDTTYQPKEISCEHGGRAPMKMVYHPKGGHCGFLFHQLEQDEELPSNSWGPAEMKRFIQHVMESSSSSE